MTMRRNSEDHIEISCDTPGCKAIVLTGQRFVNAAERRARNKGWAIGTNEDACPEHHA